MKPIFLHKGINTDSSEENQPEGTYRFALNTVLESSEGDFISLSNEQSNSIYTQVTEGYIIIGSIGIGESNIAIFLCKEDNTSSEIGILDKNSNYTPIVNTDLGFHVNYQIDAVFRLRRGCDRILYWVDNKNKPRFFNLDNPELFKTGGVFDNSKFNLIKSYEDVPIINEVEVLNTEGELFPGSYNISIQYIDENLNPSEWILTSKIINIYNDSLNNNYLDINGSENSDDEHLNFGKTNKAIKVFLSNLDISYRFYRLAFIEATTGSGEISSVRVTEEIPINKNTFVYTGKNYLIETSKEEILFNNNVIDTAQSVEQIENRLVLGNIKNKQFNFCKLQKYASKIKADVETKKIILNKLERDNPKSPTIDFESKGYMPGEIYSFGIMYQFDDGTLSPVFHIPGKNPDLGKDFIFSPGEGIYPMSIENLSGDNIYTDNSVCENDSYWGVDSEGVLLKNKQVRHHRFPTRSQLGLKLVQKEGTTANTSLDTIRFTLNVQGDLDVGAAGIPFDINVKYEVDSTIYYKTFSITPSDYNNGISPVFVNFDFYGDIHYSNNLTILSIEEIDANAASVFILDEEGNTNSSNKNLSYIYANENGTENTQGYIYSSEILGIKFSGVEIPPFSEIGQNIVGYYIVRQERDEDNKTILDSAVLTPSLKNSKYIGLGLLAPELNNYDKIHRGVYGLINPEFKFKNRKYSSFTEIQQEGTFNIPTRYRTSFEVQDVFDGSSYDSSIHKKESEDDDGWDFRGIVRDNGTDYIKASGDMKIPESNIENVIYLPALAHTGIENNTKEIYNTSADNQIGVLVLKNSQDIPTLANLPYVILKRDLQNVYSNFRTSEYLKSSNNIETTDTVTLFDGDSYISPMRYYNTVYWENRVADRHEKSGFLRKLAGFFLVVAGFLVTVFSGGSLTGLGVQLAGLGVSLIASGIKQDQYIKAYQEEYKKGLREANLDNWVYEQYHNSPIDDQIQWIGDCITDLWFESQVNVSVREKMTYTNPTFLDGPGILENTAGARKVDTHLANKLLDLDYERKGGKKYRPVPYAEWYKINSDYFRLNKEKVYFHLPLEYDCCSKCPESFPNRIVWSEQSFQEELTDNYSIFLPNNYKDIEGEKGIITDLFRIQNNLYIHTKEGLWHLPQNFQERVTDDIVSFIGTGEYFNIPPRKIVDSQLNSAGCSHKWATIKTKYGVFFISEMENKIYQFDGNSLKILSDTGIRIWSKNNISLKIDDDYYKLYGKEYPFRNNPSSKEGVGFISVYDENQKRVIFSKKDFALSTYYQDLYDQYSGDIYFCIKDGLVGYHPNYQQTIDDRLNQGWIYEGVNEGCEMVFKRITYQPITVDLTIPHYIPNDMNIYYYVNDSTQGLYNYTDNPPINAVAQIDLQMNQLQADLLAYNPNWTGNVIKRNMQLSNRYLTQMIPTSFYTQKAINIIFITDSSSLPGIGDAYYDAITPFPLNIVPSPLLSYDQDLNYFISNLYPLWQDFKALIYPIVYDNNSIISDGTNNINYPYQNRSKMFLLHTLAALKGNNQVYTLNELNNNNFITNPSFLSTEMSDAISALTISNPYSLNGLENYGFKGIFTESMTYNQQTGVTDILTPGNENRFIDNIKRIFDIGYDETQQITRIEEVVEYDYLPPQSLLILSDPDNPDSLLIKAPLFGENKSWTLSYNLFTSSFTSFHSYLPNMYIQLQENFISWIENDDNNLYIHGDKKGNFQNFYGEKKPFIIEMIDNRNPLMDNLWEDFKFYTNAEMYDEGIDSFIEDRKITFNKALFYNTNQTTGELNLIVKNTALNDENYLLNQIILPDPMEIIIDKNEKFWYINELRDIRVNYDSPIFNKKINSLINEYYIDKIVNVSTLDPNKNWNEIETFRDKYLGIRLIFDTFENIKLIFKYSVNLLKPSNR